MQPKYSLVSCCNDNSWPSWYVTLSPFHVSTRKSTHEQNCFLGAIVSSVSPEYGVTEMIHALKTVQPKYLITVASRLSVAREAAESIGLPREQIILLDNEVEGHVSLGQLLKIGKAYGATDQVLPFQIPRGKVNTDICAFISFSSGTSGLPKAVRV
jgi:4-coumarate--CoA ligase